MDERKAIYVINAMLGALIPGAEVLTVILKPETVKLIQWIAGGTLVALNTWRAYIDQHLSRETPAPAAGTVTPPTTPPTP